MKRILIAVLTLAVLSAGFLAPDAEATRREDNYLTVKLGGYFPVSNDVDYLDTGFNFEAAYGRYVTDGFAFEVGTGYLSLSGDPEPGISEDLSVIPIKVSLKGTVPYGEFEPYIIAGAGMYFIDDEIPGQSDSGSSLGFHIGFGATVDLSQNVFLGLDLQYLILKTDTFKDLAGDSRSLDGASFNLGAGYRF